MLMARDPMYESDAADANHDGFAGFAASLSPRSPDGTSRAEHDRHVEGLFQPRVMATLFAETGSSARAEAVRSPEPSPDPTRCSWPGARLTLVARADLRRLRWRGRPNLYSLYVPERRSASTPSINATSGEAAPYSSKPTFPALRRMSH